MILPTIPSYFTNSAGAFSCFHLLSITKKNHFRVNIYKLLLRGSVFRVNIYCILRQEPLQKTLCESILFTFSPCLMRIKLSCLVSCLGMHWYVLVGRRIDPSQWTQLQFGLFSVPTSGPQLVYQRPWYVLFCLWKSAYKRSLAAYRKE